VDTGDLSGLGWRVMVGSCLDRLKELPDASVDAVVTDPPYELGFMGKSWDSSGIAFNTAVWAECLRVLKPGGHLLAFGGSRTWHRIAVAVEDAGFQIRDSVAWLYGSGFPKSLDVSKAIDKRGGVIAGQSRFAGVLKKAKLQTSMSISDLNEVLGRRTSNLWSHFVGEIQPLLPTAEQYWKLKSVLPIPDEWDIQFLPEAEREVIGKKTSGIANKDEGTRHTIGASQGVEVDITAPATDDAVKWQGWGTALKPAFEPVIVARKPLVGTVAANVLEFGTGALNIDGTRIGAGGQLKWSTPRDMGFSGGSDSDGVATSNAAGRWPSNVVLDEFTAGLVDEQSGIGVSKAANRGLQVSGQKGGLAGDLPNYKEGTDTLRGHSDSGGASRFFYVAKASKRDRNEGLDALEEQRHSDREKDDGVGGDNPRNRTNAAKQNFHPTVKPTDLMRQLVRLVTPPGGVVLDPFTGSGSTGKAAILEGFEFIGCELTEEYLPIIEGRLNHAVATVKAEQEKEKEKLF
jgi:DNA modification methylase